MPGWFEQHTEGPLVPPEEGSGAGTWQVAPLQHSVAFAHSELNIPHPVVPVVLLELLDVPVVEVEVEVDVEVVEEPIVGLLVPVEPVLDVTLFEVEVEPVEPVLMVLVPVPVVLLELPWKVTLPGLKTRSQPTNDNQIEELSNQRRIRNALPR